MGNMYLSQVLYNQKLKDKFLKEYESKKDINKKTTVYYKYILQIAYNTESRLNKDIYDFNDSELNTLIKSYSNGSVAVVQSNISVLKKYLDFCVRNGYIRVNLLQDISGFDDFMPFVDKNVQKNKYINREQFEEMIAECINYQDSYPLAMAYYGFKGEDCCEITNLKVSDVNQAENTIYIANRDTLYEIDEFLMDVIVGAMNEEAYQKLLTDNATNLPKSLEYKLYKNDYVMRVSARDVNEPAKPINVTSRLNKVKTYAGNPYLTITSIWYSGMLDQAKQIYAQKGELDKADWIAIGELFGYHQMYWTKSKQRFAHLLEDDKNK